MMYRHILLVSNTAHSLWQFRRALIKDILASGGQVTCMAAEDGTSTRLTEMGARFMPVPLSRSGMSLIKEFKTVWIIFQNMKSIHPDFVVTYTIKPNSYVPLIAWIFKKPCLSVVTGLGYAFLQNTLAAKMARIALRIGLGFASAVWFLNRDDLKVLTSGSTPLTVKSSVLPGEGIDMAYFDAALFPQKSDSDFVFLMIARVLKDKGVLEFAEAAQRVKSEFPHTRFQILGSLDPENPSAFTAEQFKNLCKVSGIEYLGTSSDVRASIAQADVSVLPSYREGIPLALLETGSMGLPLIATDVAGCRDVVIDGINGFLVPPKNSDALAGAMIRMINMPEADFETMRGRVRIDMGLRFGQDIVLNFYRRALKIESQ